MDRSYAQSESSKTAPDENVARAFLEGLTGPSKGKTYWLSSDVLSTLVGSDRVLRINAGTTQADDLDLVAVLKWDRDTYSIEGVGGKSVWVNGHRIDAVHLMHGDMIEFDAHGPMARFRLCEQSFPKRWPIDEIVSDAWTYARSSRRPLPRRISFAVGESLRRAAVQTTYYFRLSVIIVLCVITVFGIYLYRSDQQIQQALERDAHRIEAVTIMLAQTRDNALSEDDLVALQQRLESRLERNTSRLGVLEERSDAAARVIAESVPSVAFVQGAFGLRHIESGEMLKQVLSADGQVLRTPFGQPRLDPFGNGNPGEFQFTGTGFLLMNGQHIVTNRHVALPWTSKEQAQAFEASGLVPEMLRLVVYFPGITGPIEAELVGHSETADLAVLSIAPSHIEGRGLSLSDSPTRVGEEIYLLGYPTGLKALLAQAGNDFISSIRTEGEVDFWIVASQLSKQNLINPLASQGIVAQVSMGAVTYDAETTVGGSGGPALNRHGHVVAVNAAILPDFGGSNIGVPVAHLDQLLNDATNK
ncbi:trypsin-like peptidase domain-containing protein [Tateyamaria sp. Alg231-49]|uniref:trypsin-like peptidase domain-containing protein n=1 Tax=Tateyamaria sp. Alg231-49 TaxID=1922219 RepID=UPI000D5526E1|nr:trypsin-like peptidase domain-containing protein [Tateyamaria sp. Alg231-49]